MTAKPPTRITSGLYYYNNRGERVDGPHPNLYGNVSGLRGDVTDLTGDYALVEPNVILAAASRKLALKKLLLSFFNPAVPGSAGSTGSYFSENALKGELDIYTSRFIAQCRAGLDSATPPWGVGEKGKVGLFQNNTPLEVTTENPLSGKSWEEQTMRMMCQRWFGAGVALPEFFLAGN
jgi:hypothetical protein